MKTNATHTTLKSLFRFTLLLVVILGINSFGWGQNLTQTNPGTYSFTVPAGVTSITIEAWGAGGGGGGDRQNFGNGGGGGGGGAYAKINSFTVVPGNSYSYTVGAGGAGGNVSNDPATGGNGGASYFINSTTLNAASGGGGPQGTAQNVAGAVLTNGGAAGSTGDVKRAGGNGYQYTDNGSTPSGGGGGGSAGPGSIGNSATSGTGAAAVTEGGPGGTGRTDNTGLTPVSGPGGGGGGADNSGAVQGGSRNGGAGFNGQIRITYTCPADAGTLTGTQTLCMEGSTTFSSSVLGGTWSSGNTGIATINASTGVISPAAVGGPITMTYTVTGSGGCTTRIATRTVTVNPSPAASVSNQKNITCFAGNDGEITILASGGTAPYQYSLTNGISYTTGSNPNPYTFNGLSAGTPYKVRVIDNNGCASPAF